MSTNATIVRKVDDVTYHAVYLHCDGYPEHAFNILTNYYDTKEKVEKLLDYGDIFSIAETIEECVFYHRDRGEPAEDVCLIEECSLEDLKDFFQGAEYTYLFEDGKWSIV